MAARPREIALARALQLRVDIDGRVLELQRMIARARNEGATLVEVAGRLGMRVDEVRKLTQPTGSWRA